jgi:radical SAM protein with 4Fe4S-binding SPASM domain
MNRAGMLDGIAGSPVDHGTDVLVCTAGYLKNLYVGVKGDAYLCCHDYYERYSYGNICEAPLATLRTSDRRKEMLKAFRSDFCRRCPFAATFERLAGRLPARGTAR